MRQNAKEQMKTSRGLCEIIHEATEQQVREDLAGNAQHYTSLAQQGRNIIERALASNREEQTGVEDLRRGLGALVRVLRHEKRLTAWDVANGANIDLKELECIESDPGFDPNPRTIVQLAEYFSLPPRSLVVLSGAIPAERMMRDEAVKFAACAKNMDKLSRTERKLLSGFVRFLRDYTEK